MTPLSQHLIALELRSAPGGAAPERAAFRVCEKLRRPLCVLAGVAGYRSLLARSLALSRTQAPWLAEVKIGPDAALELPPEAAARLDAEEVARGGALLVAELLGLLAALVGATLTLRLVRNAWPDAPLTLSEIELDPS